MRFRKDTTGKLEKAVLMVVDKYFPDLAKINFLCVWRDKEKFVDGRQVLAEVIKLSNRYRDTFDYDVMVLVDSEAWKLASKLERKKLLYHELHHIKLEYDLETTEILDKSAQELFEEYLVTRPPEGEPKLDKEGRICFKVIPHDLDIRRFSSELLKFGLSPEEEAVRQFLNYVYKEVGLAQ